MAGRQRSAENANFLSFYTDDAPGLKMSLHRTAPHNAQRARNATVYCHCSRFDLRTDLLLLLLCSAGCVCCSGPTTVLVLSLAFIGAVVMLHIFGKLVPK